MNNNKMPIVSIVIPLYNKERYIAQAIESVLKQTVASWELIIVDSGSTDNSVTIASQYSNEKIHIVVRSKEGPAIARNQGIQLANGNLIAFLDADDEWMPDFLENVLFLQKKYPDAGMYGTGYEIQASGHIIRENILYPEQGDRILTSYYLDTAQCGFTISNTSSCAIPKSVLMDVGLFNPEYPSGEELDLFGRIALKYPVAYMPKVCTIYRAGADNSFDRMKLSRYVPMTKFLEKQPLEIQNEYLKKCCGLQEYLDSYYLKLGCHNIYTGLRRLGREQLKHVIQSEYPQRSRAYLFLFLSYLPIPYSKIPSKFIRNVAHKFHMAS